METVFSRAFETIALAREGSWLIVTLDRPATKNAIDTRMIEELSDVVAGLADSREIRAVLLRGAGGSFCSGGDPADFAAARASAPSPGEPDPLTLLNRCFGTLLEAMDRIPAVVVAIVDGIALGGGLGFCCVADLVLAHEAASFRLPETGLGIPPAQIAPFLVRRLGLARARRLALTGARLDAQAAVACGLADEVFVAEDDLSRRLGALREEIARCAPAATATTKVLLLGAATQPLPAALDEGARAFAAAVRGPEGAEGVAAFLARRKPPWSGS